MSLSAIYDFAKAWKGAPVSGPRCHQENDGRDECLGAASSLFLVKTLFQGPRRGHSLVPTVAGGEAANRSPRLPALPAPAAGHSPHRDLWKSRSSEAQARLC